MRFLSLVLLSGCALVDAAGESTPGGGSSGLSFDRLNISNTGGNPRQAIPIDLDGINGLDVVVLSDTGSLFRAFNNGDGVFSVQPGMFNGYSRITVGDVDGDGKDEIIGLSAAGTVGTLTIFKPNASLEGFATTDVSGALDPADKNDPPVAIEVFRFAGVPALAIAYENDSNLRIIFDPATAPQGMDFDAMLQPPPHKLTTAVGDFDPLTNSDEILFADGDGQITQIFQCTSGCVLDTKPVQLSEGADRVQLFAIGNFASTPDLDLSFIGEYVSGPDQFHMRIGLGAAGGTMNVGSILDFSAIALGAADIDGDGLTDSVALVDEGIDPFVRVVAANFEELQIDIGSGSGMRPRSITFGDFNADGKADILLLPPAQGGVDYLLSR